MVFSFMLPFLTVEPGLLPISTFVSSAIVDDSNVTNLQNTYHSKKVGSFSKLRHGHPVHTFFISFYEPSFLNTFMPVKIPKVHHKICIHEDGKKKWGGGGAPLGQSIKSGHPLVPC